MGWAGITNSKLIKLCEVKFDILITSDKNIIHQQNLTGKRLAIIVLPSNRVPIIVNLLPKIERVLAEVHPGTLTQIPLQ